MTMRRLLVISFALLTACSQTARSTGPGSSTVTTASTALATTSLPVAVTAITTAPTTIPAPASATTAAAVPIGPAAATIDLTGDAGVTGGLAQAKVRCSFPAAEGQTITIVGQWASVGTSAIVIVSADAVTVRLSAGTGSDVHLRAFTGPGAPGFDAARGAHLDATLTEKAVAGFTAGGLGVVSSIKGDAQCNGQQTGSSTLVFAGDTPDGAISAGLDHPRVECFINASGVRVTAIGYATVGAKRVVVSLNTSADGFSISQVTADGGTYLYTATAPGVVSTTTTGGHVDGTATQQSATGGGRTIRVTGDATCGTTTNY